MPVCHEHKLHAEKAPACHKGGVCWICRMEAEVERLRQTAMNGWQCSKCMKEADSPICTYCDECYSELVQEIERLRQRREILNER